MGERENGRARETREGWGSYLFPCVSPSHAPVFSYAHYFQAPATQAIFKNKWVQLGCTTEIVLFWLVCFCFYFPIGKSSNLHLRSSTESSNTCDVWRLTVKHSKERSRRVGIQKSVSTRWKEEIKCTAMKHLRLFSGKVSQLWKKHIYWVLRLKRTRNFLLNEPLVRRPYLRYMLTADYKSRDVSGNESSFPA